jgi:Flp pilus assembly protein TadG
MRQTPRTGQQRRGKVLVLVALTLTLLMGMVGLTVDSGLLQTARRQVQNAADAAAMAAAMELFRGNSLAGATSVATTYVQNNGLTDAAVSITVQVPQSGMYRGNANYVEVIVTAPVSIYFMPILGVAPKQTVAGRAVAGAETPGLEGVIALNPLTAPGLLLKGPPTLMVNGAVIVNSAGGGLDQYGNSVRASASLGDAVWTNSTGSIVANSVLVHGGVRDPSAISNIADGGPNPLFANAPVVPNPLRDLPVPDGSNGAVVTFNKPSSISANDGDVLSPGVYNNIYINNAANVTFKPGIYILSPKKNGDGLAIAGNSSVSANGVMFYLTGSDYLDPSSKNPKAPGYYDKLDTPLDGPLPPTNGSFPPAPDPDNTVYATLSITAVRSTLISMTGLNDPSSPFNGLLFYQRPRNSNPITMRAYGSANVNLGGTLYAPWADMSLQSINVSSGPIFVGTLSLIENTLLLVNGKGSGSAKQVFLVE